MPSVQGVVEDILQEMVLEKLIASYRPDIEIVGISGRKGNAYIRQKLKAFNAASAHLPHIIITDLDRKACAPGLLEEWVNFKMNPNFLFRIAEKEIEAWILADREEAARFPGVSVTKIPSDTQSIPDPKVHIINLARTSRKRTIKDIIPIGTSTQGPGYNSILSDFILNYWNPERAAGNNRSLQKAIQKLMEYLR